MDWEAELLKLLRTADPQVILMVLFLSEITKKAMWQPLQWSKDIFLIVPVIWAFPLTWFLWGVGTGNTWQFFFWKSLSAGAIASLVYQLTEPIFKKRLNQLMKKWLGNNEPEKLKEPVP